MLVVCILVSLLVEHSHFIIQFAPETEIEIWICPKSHVMLLHKNDAGNNKNPIWTLYKLRVNKSVWLGGSQRQQPDNMFSVGAEGNVQLQHISIVDMNICDTCQWQDSDSKKTQDTIITL